MRKKSLFYICKEVKILNLKIRLKKRKNQKNWKAAFAGAYVALSMASVEVQAKPAEPSFNGTGFEQLLAKWTGPVMDFLLLATIPIGGISAVVTGIIWVCKEEEYRDQHPLKNKIVKVVVATIVIELIPTIYKLLNMQIS